MSRPFRPARPVEERSAAECMCHVGGPCTSYQPGHALHLVQARLAAATPGEWVDGFVVNADPDAGVLTVRTLEGVVTTFENAAGAAASVARDEPVAVHARYRVLAVGRRRFNLREIG
ncbi:hypothetical protein [Microbacterium sp. SORGH_AS_0888]|uniref:hypothetical protein n=1 Tax=Microbacterium sp. SORGH_AS_0888 TaxID=3041791 RepID=UPI002781E7D2|nr:hypothetical protein [Microbacterium sp. SORGH_AS_0888]MDQ1128905.1 hypothetical protein [Microbacterium sp. SORGH_AS_0888]